MEVAFLAQLEDWKQRELVRRVELKALRKVTGMLEVLEEKEGEGAFTVSLVSARMLKMIRDHREQANSDVNRYEGTELEVIGDDIYHWRLRLTALPPSCRLAQDLIMLESNP